MSQLEVPAPAPLRAPAAARQGCPKETGQIPLIKGLVRTRLVSAILAGFLFCGCGGDGRESSPVSAVAGTAVVFDLDANLADSPRFYDLPFPSDLRRDAAGRTSVNGFPRPPGSAIIVPVVDAAGGRPGFATTQTAYFRFDGPLAARHPDEVIPGAINAPVLLVDVDPRSAKRGWLLPTVASTLAPDAYAPSHLLAVGPAPGIVLDANRTYGVVVRRNLGDADGLPLGIPLPVAQLAAGIMPAGAQGPAMATTLDPLWVTLDQLGLERETVAAATVFTTGDVVLDLERMSGRLLERHVVTIENLRLDAEDGTRHERFCLFRGYADLPQFQAGRPPFNRDGHFVLDEHEVPVVQRTERVPVVVTVPRQTMPPGGFPLVLYAHGSGGHASQVVDRGPVTTPGGAPEPGKGPAHVLAEHGFATVASALPLNPERLPGGDPRAYLNLRNLQAYAFTFQQGTTELRLLLDAVERLWIEPPSFATCDGLELPDGERSLRFQSNTVFALGQSMGAQYVTMLGAVDQRITAVVPTGSGGLWSLVILKADGATSGRLVAMMLGTSVTLDFLHPGLQLVQMAFEPAEPFVFARRIAHRPLPGHPARHIYQPIGLDDPSFPNEIYNAIALAYGNHQAGEVLQPDLQDTLALGGLAGLLGLPARDNTRPDAAGEARTAVVVQYAGDGILDSHHIFSQLDAVKYQYGCFFRTASDLGVGVVPPALPLGSPCPRR